MYKDQKIMYRFISFLILLVGSFFVNSILEASLFLVLIISMYIVNKVSIKKMLPLLTFGLLLSIFIFFINYLTLPLFMYAFNIALLSFIKYFILVGISYLYINVSTHKELGITVTNISKIFGLKEDKQNYLFVQIQFILTQSIVIINEAKKMFIHVNQNNKNLFIIFMNIFMIINPLINKILKLSEMYTLSLLNKNILSKTNTNYYLPKKTMKLNLLVINVLILIVLVIT
ncbi:MAG: hypothetical protein ACK5HS_02960 [Mycoplasmatales bacterium]